MISDAYTAKVLGLIGIVFVVIIDVSTIAFSRAPGSPIFPFALVVTIPSLPFIAVGVWFLKNAARFDK